MELSVGWPPRVTTAQLATSAIPAIMSSIPCALGLGQR